MPSHVPGSSGPTTKSQTQSPAMPRIWSYLFRQASFAVIVGTGGGPASVNVRLGGFVVRLVVVATTTRRIRGDQPGQGGLPAGRQEAPIVRPDDGHGRRRCFTRRFRGRHGCGGQLRCALANKAYL